MMIIEDKGNKEDKHLIKNRWFDANDIEVLRVPLPVGDYIIANDTVLDVIKRKTVRGLEVKKMDFLGSYKVTVDTKEDIQELIGNVCGKQHGRFRDECILAQNNKIKLYVLVDNAEGVKSIEDLFQWHNPRLDIMKNGTEIIGHYKSGKPMYERVQKYPAATSGQTLAKALLTMQEKYGVTFLFCEPREAGKKIVELLKQEE